MVTDFNSDIVPHLALHLLKAPPLFKTLWVLSTCSTIIVVLLSLKHLSVLILTGTKLRRERDTVFQPILATLYKCIFCFFPLMAVLSWAALFAPRLSLMFLLVVRLYEFGCLMWFWELMVDLLDGPDSAFRILSAKEPRHVLKVFPCCLTPFIYSKRRLRKRDICISWWLVAQYGPVNVISILTVALSSHLQTLFTGLSATSLVACMHGLFIIYASSHSESKEFRLTLKFLVIKLSVMIIKVVEILVRIPGVVRGHDFPYNEALMGMTWLCVSMNTTAFIFTIAAMISFPAREISARLDKHIDAVNMRVGSLEFVGNRYGKDTSTEEMVCLSPQKKPPGDPTEDIKLCKVGTSNDVIRAQTSTAASDDDATSDRMLYGGERRVVGKSAFEISNGAEDKS